MAIAGAFAACAFAVTPAALACGCSPVGGDVQRADVALRATVSATASGNVSVPLSELTSQLGVAAKVSTQLVVRARTRRAEQIAASALSLVAREETKAEANLTAELSAAASVEQAAIAKAATTIDHRRELTLGALAKLASGSVATTPLTGTTLVSASAAAHAAVAGTITAATTAGARRRR